MRAARYYPDRRRCSQSSMSSLGGEEEASGEAVHDEMWEEEQVADGHHPALVVAALLLPVLLLALVVDLPMMPVWAEGGLHNAPFWFHFFCMCFFVSSLLFPFATLMSGLTRVPVSVWVLAMAVPSGVYSFTSASLLAVFQISGVFFRPWSALQIVAIACLFFLIPMPLTAAIVIRLVRDRKATLLDDDAGVFNERAFLWAFVLMTAGIVVFFLIAFVFLTLFHAARETAGLQLFAMLVYQIVAHVLFKKTYSLYALSSLSESQRLRTYPAVVSVFEAIAELFLAFSFPSVRNYGLLVFAVIMETIMFIVPVRRMHEGYMNIENKFTGLFFRSKKARVIPMPGTPKSRSASSRQSGRTQSSSRTSGRSEVGMEEPAPVEAVGEGDEEQAWAVGGMMLVNKRRVASFGALFIFEFLSAMTFALFFGLMCFSHNARFYGFGSHADGTCTAGEYALPVSVSVGTALIHVVVFVYVRRFLIRTWTLDPWALCVSWIKNNLIFIGVTIPVTVAQIVVLLEAHYDMSGFARSVVE